MYPSFSIPCRTNGWDSMTRLERPMLQKRMTCYKQKWGTLLDSWMGIRVDHWSHHFLIAPCSLPPADPLFLVKLTALNYNAWWILIYWFREKKSRAYRTYSAVCFCFVEHVYHRSELSSFCTFFFFFFFFTKTRDSKMKQEWKGEPSLIKRNDNGLSKSENDDLRWKWPW
jgi:hypothetical protein